MQNVKEKQILGPKIINIFDRQKIEVQGAIEIISSTEKEIYVKLLNGIMLILGEGLTIQKLLPEEEMLVVSGRVDGVNFKSKQTKKSLFGKVFK
jgi:hypothetical protein